MLITVVRCCRLWCCLLSIRNDCKKILVIFSPPPSVSLFTRCHILPSTCISLSSFIALTGRPGSRVFPHQQYPCWCRPKGETTVNFLTFCLHNILALSPCHPAYSPLLPQRHTWSNLGRLPVYSIDHVTDLGS